MLKRSRVDQAFEGLPLPKRFSQGSEGRPPARTSSSLRQLGAKLFRLVFLAPSCASANHARLCVSTTPIHHTMSDAASDNGDLFGDDVEANGVVDSTNPPVSQNDDDEDEDDNVVTKRRAATNGHRDEEPDAGDEDDLFGDDGDDQAEDPIAFVTQHSEKRSS